MVTWLLPLLGGLLVGAFGTAIHRTIFFFNPETGFGLPLGLIIALLLTLSAALLVRAAGGTVSLLSYAIGLILAIQVLSLARPGGSVLILDPTQSRARFPYLGLIWALASAALLLAAFLLPAKWFRRPQPTYNVPTPTDVAPSPTPSFCANPANESQGKSQNPGDSSDWLSTWTPGQ